ncbi:MAG: LPP20 family lipoprotein [Nitrospira sp.]|nr:LPP20 family lipoprotein [Nitrospira sp.]
MSTGPGLVQPGWGLLCALFLTTPALAADTTTPDVRDKADQTFERLHKREQRNAPESIIRPQQDHAPLSHAEQFLIGQGQGDLSKGKLVCQRVSELAARADIAKQIRVLVKEHATDRLRERTGREAEQDIEVVREEIVQEYLQGVNIIERRADEETKTCSATAVMSKNQLLPKPSQESSDPGSAVRR